MKPAQWPKMSVLWFFQSRATNAIVGAILVIVFAVFLFVAWQKWTTPSQPADYEGKIVDRWVDIGGKAQGYRPQPLLVIESDEGARFTVKVDPNVYESAKVGIRIKRKSGQIVLIDSDKQTDK